MIAQISFEHEIPIGLGLLTVLALEQGYDRSGGEKGNKGEEAMSAAISSALAIRMIEEDLDDGMGDADAEDLEEDADAEEYEYVEEEGADEDDEVDDVDADDDHDDHDDHEYEEGT